MLKNTKAKLTLKENSQPKFCRARQVRYALRPKVEAELTKLQNANILTKVEWSEWASPIVPVIKKNGNVRLCGDFKTTINPVLQVQQYTLFQELIIFLLPLGVYKRSASSIYVKRIFRWKWKKRQESCLPSTHTRGYSNTTGLYLVWQ